MSVLLLALALSSTPPGAPAGASAVTEKLKDGTALVYARVAGARRVSVRLVVRSGGDDDPPGKAGTAHLLEHLVFHGTYEEKEGVLFQRAWGLGADMNAFTGPESTTYVVDVPTASFGSFVPGFLATVTSPALPFASFEREKGVVGAEHQDFANVMGIAFAIDQLVFPSVNGGATVIGTEQSREAITIDDVQQFFSAHYVPKNMVLIVTGDLPIDAVRTAAEAGLRGAPGVGVPTPEEAPAPNLPSEAKNLSYLTVTAHGRLVDGVTPAGCAAAAGVLELRLRKRVVADEGLVAQVNVICHRQREHDFIVLMVATSSPESSQVPDWMRAVVRAAVHTPPTAKERAIVDSRLRTSRVWTRARSTTLADALMASVGRVDVPLDRAVSEVMSPPPLAWGEFGKVLGLASQDSHLAEVHFSRFEE